MHNILILIIWICSHELQDLFASDIIPQYFDHNKFSSFARQLNFYGFRKIQTKPILKEDYDQSTAKFVTFFNEKFKRGRYDLLKEIQRSTRGGGSSSTDHAREVEALRNAVSTLENRVQELEGRWQDTEMKMERQIHAKVELAMMELLSGRQNSNAALQAQHMGLPNLASSYGGDMSALQRAERSFGSIGRNPQWDNPLLGAQAARAFSTASASSMGNRATSGGGNIASGATLPPHPKQKSLPPPMGGGAARTTSGGLQNMANLASGGLNPGNMNSSMLLRNAWEDKFFSTLMMSDGASRAASLAGMAGNNVSGLAALAAAQQQMQANKAGQAAAFLQAQRNASAGRGGVGGFSGGALGLNPSESMKRQTTAEILLEPAGELNNGKGKSDGKGKGGSKNTSV